MPYDDWPLNDQELRISRGLLGSPMSFDFLLLAGNDIYPDSANGGANGGVFTYALPEPGNLTLLALFGMIAALRRRH